MFIVTISFSPRGVIVPVPSFTDRAALYCRPPALHRLDGFECLRELGTGKRLL